MQPAATVILWRPDAGSRPDGRQRRELGLRSMDLFIEPTKRPDVKLATM